MSVETPEKNKERNFHELLEARWELDRFTCVGLDIDPDSPKFPQHLLEQCEGNKAEAMVAFGCIIADTTHEFVCAYKPNSAFYEAQGPEGYQALYRIIAYIKKKISRHSDY